MSDVDMSIEPKSDQLNAEDMLTGPRVVTITKVKRGTTEQPVNIETAEFGPGRPFKPSKTVRRILVAAWGPDSSTYVGRRMMLYRDPAVRFGGMEVGGIRVSALSHIDKPVSVALTVTRGRRAPYVVEPLAESVDASPTPKPIPDDFADKLRAEDITVEALEKARTYLEGKRADFPDEAADLLALVNGRLAEIAGGAA